LLINVLVVIYFPAVIKPPFLIVVVTVTNNEGARFSLCEFGFSNNVKLNLYLRIVPTPFISFTRIWIGVLTFCSTQNKISDRRTRIIDITKPIVYFADSETEHIYYELCVISATSAVSWLRPHALFFWS